ncbi:hypothetical protein ACTPOE_13800 [Castellaniella sp. WN]
MLFRHTRPNDALLRALRAAVATHHPAALRALLASHGEQAFAHALADLSGRVIADALSMLLASDRAPVLNRLSRAARLRLQETGSRHALDPACARPAATLSSLFLPR